MRRRQDKKKGRSNATAGLYQEKKGSATSSALYQLAATPHRALKEIEATDGKTERRSKRDAEEETQELLSTNAGT